MVPVILFHAGFELFSGGFVGVDLFFVISGYLITTILIEDLDNNRFSILNFYERRARRILPALFFVMLVCIPFAWIWMLPSQMEDFAKSLAAVSFFVSNVLFERQSGYFEASADEKPLLHTWSLAVEEQYYILFPIFILLTWRYGKNRVLFMIVVIATISFLLSEWGWRKNANVNFYLLPTRAWELLAGSIAAFILVKKGVQKHETLALLGLCAIVFSIFFFDGSTPFPSAYALVPVIGVVMLILFAEKDTLVARMLGQKVFVGLGLISYSAYLWHQPIFAFSRIKLLKEPSELLMVALSALSLLLAVVSWKYIEKPFRDKSSIFSKRKPMLVFSLLGMFLFFALGFFGYIYAGFKDRFSTLLGGDVGHLVYHQYVDEHYFDCEPSEIAASAPTYEEFLRCKQSKEGEFEWLLLGDSHAAHLFLGLAEANPKINLAFYILNAPPYRDEVEFQQIFNVIANAQGAKKIFLTMHFVSRVTSTSELVAGLSKTILFLKKLGHEVILVGDIPSYDIEPDSCKFGDSIEHIMRYCSMPQPQFQQQRDIYEPTLLQLSSEFDLPFITIHEPLCSAEDCSIVHDGNVLYRDRNHLNIPGSIMIGGYLSSRFEALKIAN